MLRFLGRPARVAITAQMGTYVNGDKTSGEDEAFAIADFARRDRPCRGELGKPGGMDDRIEIYGSRGVTYGNLHMGNALRATPKWLWLRRREGTEHPGAGGFPCTRTLELRLSPGDGALRALREGHGGAPGDRSRWMGRRRTPLRRVPVRRFGPTRWSCPLTPAGVARPIDLWKSPRVM